MRGRTRTGATSGVSTAVAARPPLNMTSLLRRYARHHSPFGLIWPVALGVSSKTPSFALALSGWMIARRLVQRFELEFVYGRVGALQGSDSGNCGQR